MNKYRVWNDLNGRFRVSMRACFFFFFLIVKSCVKGGFKFVAANWNIFAERTCERGWVRNSSLQLLWTGRFELLNVVAMVHLLWNASNSGKTIEERGWFCWTVWVPDLCVRKMWRAASVSENRSLSWQLCARSLLFGRFCDLVRDGESPRVSQQALLLIG